MAEETGFREALDLYIGDGEHVSMNDVLCKAVHLHEEHRKADRERIDELEIALKEYDDAGAVEAAEKPDADEHVINFRDNYIECPDRERVLQYRRLRRSDVGKLARAEREAADLRAEVGRLTADRAEAHLELADLREKLAALEGENKMLWEDEISEVYTSAQHLSDLLESERTARREVERERDEALRKASGQPELRNVMGLGIDPDEE